MVNVSLVMNLWVAWLLDHSVHQPSETLGMEMGVAPSGLRWNAVPLTPEDISVSTAQCNHFISCRKPKRTRVIWAILYRKLYPGSSVSTVPGYGLEYRAIGVLSPAGASVSRPALGSTQPPVQWVPWVLFPVLKPAGTWRWPLTPI
jgi:hypothetical protein